MGAVYQAWDQELGIALALKVILPGIADSAAAREMEQRFKRELLLARQVTHKNVVRIHDMGEIDGIKYITMSYVDGSDLATILKEQRKLPIPRTLRIIRQVISGLTAAHDAGIVHRDLKPANIMIDAKDDEALIMDFGIARMAEAGVSDRASESLPSDDPRYKTTVSLGGETMFGAVVGTYQYMAPEQAQGLQVGPRADIYALGLIVYDTLVGPVRSEAAPRLSDELNARMKAAPPPISTIDPSIPEPLSRIVSRCLEPDPAARFQSTGALADALGDLDEDGKPLPITRRLSLRQVAALILPLLIVLLAALWFLQPQPPPVKPDPVSVVIADFHNGAGDPAFDRTLEPMIKLALEDADFITAYGRAEISRGLGVHPPDVLDSAAAREIALSQGLGVVLTGDVERKGGGYELSMTASHAVAGDVIGTFQGDAADKDKVLGVAAKLATEIRDALGDQTSDSAQLFAMEALSSTSLDVVREYAGAMEALSDSKFEQSLAGFSKAVDLDPSFGLAYAGMAIASRNLDKQQDAENYVKEALRHLDGMTERERYRTRGLFYMVTGDQRACVKEYSDLIARYSQDAAARNNLALCSTYLRDMPTALEEMRQVVKILPNRPVYRENLALYAAYGSDFPTAEQEAQKIDPPGLFGSLALAFGQLGQGQVTPAAQTYESLTKFDALGVSYAASGLADLALYMGRLSDAARLFEQGAASDEKREDRYRAASKLAALAHTQLLRGRKQAALAAAEKALADSSAVKIRFLTARVFVEAGEFDRAQKLSDDLAAEFQAEPRAYARIIEAEIALKQGNVRPAVTALNDANALLDTWIGHYDLGLAYLAAEAYPQADSEFDRCLARRGEAMALFLDEEPSYGYFPPVYYYQGRAREGLGSGFRDSYGKYLDIRGQAGEDPLLAEARRRAGK